MSGLTKKSVVSGERGPLEETTSGVPGELLIRLGCFSGSEPLRTDLLIHSDHS